MSTFKLVINLLGNLPFDKKVKLFLIFLLMIISAFFELLNIGAIIPFIHILINPESFFRENYHFISNLFNDNPDLNQRIFVSVIFLSLIFLSGVIRLCLLYFGTRVAFDSGSFISEAIYKKTLKQSYLSFISQNTGDFISGVVNKVTSCIFVINNAIIFCSSLIVFLFIIISSTIYNFYISLTILGFVSVFYFIIIYLVKHILFKLSYTLSNNQNLILRLLQDTLKGFRELKLKNLNFNFFTKFEKLNFSARKSEAYIFIISGTPRIIIEVCAIFALSIYVIYLTEASNEINSYLPLLGAIVIAGNRILHSLQLMFSSWANITGSRDSIIHILELINRQNFDEKIQSKLDFKNSINLENISFQFNTISEYILKDLNFEVKKGEKIGIIGPSGAGKSTLINIFSGLIKPQNGEIYIDKIKLEDINRRDFQNKISYTSNESFYLDDTILENIKFNNNFNQKKLINSLNISTANEFVSKLSKGTETSIGENGSKLSSGQKQRLAIARAVYQDPIIEIYDEATNSIDLSTESKLINNLVSRKDKTIVFITHNIYLLKKFDIIYELKNKKLYKIGSFKKLINNLND